MVSTPEGTMLASLPPKLLLTLCGYLAPLDLIRLRSTCKVLQKVIRQGYQRPFFKNGNTGRNPLSAFQKFVTTYDYQMYVAKLLEGPVIGCEVCYISDMPSNLVKRYSRFKRNLCYDCVRSPENTTRGKHVRVIFPNGGMFHTIGPDNHISVVWKVHSVELGKSDVPFECISGCKGTTQYYYWRADFIKRAELTHSKSWKEIVRLNDFRVKNVDFLKAFKDAVDVRFQARVDEDNNSLTVQLLKNHSTMENVLQVYQEMREPTYEYKVLEMRSETLHDFPKLAEDADAYQAAVEHEVDIFWDYIFGLAPLPDWLSEGSLSDWKVSHEEMLSSHHRAILAKSLRKWGRPLPLAGLQFACRFCQETLFGVVNMMTHVMVCHIEEYGTKWSDDFLVDETDQLQ